MLIGSLFSGYGGLDMAVRESMGASVAWHAEIDPAASAVLAHHRSDVPNLGDVTAVDWSRVEPVDILTAGFPCQPVSLAGKRAGTADERWLFGEGVLAAIRGLRTRPRLLVLENVPGLLSANGGRAMASVVQGLASCGYVGRYGVVAASGVGAPHRRRRWFCIARPAAHADERGRDGRPPVERRVARGGAAAAGDSEDLAPDTASQRWLQGLPQPAGFGGGPDAVLGDPVRWGRYAEAVARWEAILGRPAPAPTILGARGQPKLSPYLVEWMMGLPEGHVTDAPGLSINQRLKVARQRRRAAAGRRRPHLAPRCPRRVEEGGGPPMLTLSVLVTLAIRLVIG